MFKTFRFVRSGHPALAIVMAVSLLMLPMATNAAERKANPVAPLGFALGEATRSGVTAGLRDKAALESTGTNRYSQGPMLTAKGEGLGIEGLQEALFIFDQKDILVAVQLTLDKEFERGFDKAYRRLLAKYPLVNKDVPFVGDKSARFESGNCAILLDAPHLSFAMAVTYMTKGFETAFRTLRRQDAEAKEKNEGGKF